MFRDAYRYILSNTNKSLDSVSDSRVKEVVDIIEKSKQIFVYGSGRSGLVGKFFAMRLVQLGFTSYFIGETITPVVTKDDAVILISNTGKTKSTLLVASVVKNIGAEIIAITSNAHSPLAKYGDVVIHVNVPKTNGNYAPLGTMFEISTVILLDSLVSELMERTSQSEEDLRRRHAIWV